VHIGGELYETDKTFRFKAIPVYRLLLQWDPGVKRSDKNQNINLNKVD
jgi:hypothetical protein